MSLSLSSHNRLISSLEKEYSADLFDGKITESSGNGAEEEEE